MLFAHVGRSATGRFFLTLICGALILPAGASGQRGGGDVAHYPDFRTGRELVISGVGAGLFAAGFLTRGSDRIVPMEGFDPDEISWSFDRDIIGNRSLDAHLASNWTRNAAIALPFLSATLFGTSGERTDALMRRGLLYAETYLVTLGVTYLAKSTLDRPRPFAYLAAADRPDTPAYDVTRDRTFHSLPSGHASTAWTGAAITITEHLMTRPDAAGLERAGVGFIGGFLAGATSGLRVEGGQHFPTDVIAGAGVGIGIGTVIPLLHRGDRPLPPVRAWLQALGGTLAGTLAGVVLSQTY